MDDFGTRFAFFYCLFPKEHHCSSFSSFLLSDSFTFISFFHFLSLSKKKCLAVRHRTACQFPTHYALIVFKYGQMWFMHIKQVYFLFSKQEENISSRSSRDQNKLCTHDKNWKHADLWVKNNLLCFNVCISFGTCKFNVWIDVDLLQFYPTSPVTTTTTTTTTIIIIIIIFFNII